MIKKIFWCVAIKRSASNKEFIKDNAHCPPINRFAVSLPENNFWSNIIWCAKYLQHKEQVNNMLNTQKLWLLNHLCMRSQDVSQFQLLASQNQTNRCWKNSSIYQNCCMLQQMFMPINNGSHSHVHYLSISKLFAFFGFH